MINYLLVLGPFYGDPTENDGRHILGEIGHWGRPTTLVSSMSEDLSGFRQL